MRRIFIFSIVVFSTFTGYCQKSKFCLGVIIGDPTGISSKIWVNENSAFDIAAAWDIAGGNDALWLHADFLKHKFDLLNPEKGQLPLYFGVGARVIFTHDAIVTARVPLGISYLFEDIPFDSFLEIVPALNVLPTTEIDLDAAIGFRYYF